MGGAVVEDRVNPNNAKQLTLPSRLRIRGGVLAPANSLAAEQYRLIRSKLVRLKAQRPLTTVAVTSAMVGEGKSTTSANLAMVLAQAIGQRVVLVDCDLRRPTLHRVFGCLIGPGLSDVLREARGVDEALRPIEDGMLSVLPSGSPPPNPTELLGSEAMDRLLDGLRGRFDFVVMDVPPILPLADPFVLGCKADGIIMVVRAGATPRDVVAMSLDNLPRDRVIGVILNDVGIDDSPYQRYAHIQYEGAYMLR
jgi:capsular exopolysaccharide synthesis family protein